MSLSDGDILPSPHDKAHHVKKHHDEKKTKKANASTGASAAGIRALSAQMVAFYFRAPAKAFFRTRVE